MPDQAPALQLTNPAEHVPYRVVSVQEREELLPDNRFEEQVVVSYEGPSGSTHTVKVPKRLYTPAYVDQVVQADLHNHEDVHSLGAAPHPENLAGAEGIPAV